MKRVNKFTQSWKVTKYWIYLGNVVISIWQIYLICKASFFHYYLYRKMRNLSRSLNLHEYLILLCSGGSMLILFSSFHYRKIVYKRKTFFNRCHKIIFFLFNFHTFLFNGLTNSTDASIIKIWSCKEALWVLLILLLDATTIK